MIAYQTTVNTYKIIKSGKPTYVAMKMKGRQLSMATRQSASTGVFALMGTSAFTGMIISAIGITEVCRMCEDVRIHSTPTWCISILKAT